MPSMQIPPYFRLNCKEDIAPSRCWPLPDGVVGWACGPKPPSPADMALVMDYVAKPGAGDAPSDP
jgi:hypothetical protein